MSKSIEDGAGTIALSDDKIEAAGAELYEVRRAEARANVAMWRRWATEGA
jgi:hypothetical protein